MAQTHSTARPGMPDPTTIVETRVLEPPTPPAPGAPPVAGVPHRTYRIFRTNQVDEYEAPPTSNAEILAAPAAMQAAGDSYAGTDRKAAKLSIAAEPVETFSDLSDVIASLPAHDAMKHHVPKITTDAKSGRVSEEKRNIRTTAWLYAASGENDRDFHAILGRDPSETNAMYMTMEISGLPPKSRKSFSTLKKVRDTYKTFFAGNLPGTGYDFFDPPIKVEIGGSLFWDATHASGSRPGPKDLRAHMPVIWEVHPVTFLTFEP